jgi:hypothetical protein
METTESTSNLIIYKIEEMNGMKNRSDEALFNDQNFCAGIKRLITIANNYVVAEQILKIVVENENDNENFRRDIRHIYTILTGLEKCQKIIILDPNEITVGSNIKATWTIATIYTHK